MLIKNDYEGFVTDALMGACFSTQANIRLICRQVHFIDTSVSPTYIVTVNEDTEFKFRTLELAIDKFNELIP